MRLARRQWDATVARHAAWSGVHRALADLAADAEPFDGRFDIWQGLNADAYRAEPVGDDAFFTLFRPNPEPSDEAALGGDLYYGIEDENGKLDINAADPTVLQALPGMSAEIG